MTRCFDMLAWIFDPNAWIARLTLTAPEIVLGIDK
jgi:predicted tellurium resistance membrane protein TerC